MSGHNKFPIFKKSRSLDFSLLENKKEFNRRKLNPNVRKKRKKQRSVFFFQNQEKQKLRLLYGLKEKQLRNLFVKLKTKKNIDEFLLMNLESRLDNVVFRSKIVETRRAARKLVNDGHLLVGGRKRSNIGYRLKPNDIISFKKEVIGKKSIKEKLKQITKIPKFISINEDNATINFLSFPSSFKELNININLSLVKEYYSKRI